MLPSGLGTGAAQALTKVAMASEEKADCTSLTSPEPRGLATIATTTTTTTTATATTATVILLRTSPPYR